MAEISVILSCLLTIPILVILYTVFKIRKNVEYFRKRNIPYLSTSFHRTVKFIMGFGNCVELEEESYKAAVDTKEPLVGIFDVVGQLSVYVTDINLIKSICLKDFDHFVNRRPIRTEQSTRCLNSMLFATQDDHWKAMRSKLSPLFTTGKIRGMFHIFQKSSERLENYLKEQMEYPKRNSVDLDFMQIFSKYVMDVIASCAFGVNIKSFDMKPKQRSTFEQMGTQFGFRGDVKSFLKLILVIIAPKIADFFDIGVIDHESQNYFSSLVKIVMKERRETGERKDDFLQLMMDVQQGLLRVDEQTDHAINGTNDSGGDTYVLTNDNTIHGKLVFDDDTIVANVLAFLMAGFDPVQSVLLFTLYALATEPEVQRKLYEEVKEILHNNGGRLSYDAINQMNYLDLVLNESMRVYPSATRTERYCSKDYPVPGTKMVIEKGTVVLLPLCGVHQDPRYFPNPKKFDPERHTPENKAHRHPYAFMPFGHGPRSCIGMRFALVKAKAALAQLVYSFHFTPCSRTKIPMEFDRNPNAKPKESLWLNVAVRVE